MKKKLKKIHALIFSGKTCCKKSENANMTKANASQKTPGNSRAI